MKQSNVVTVILVGLMILGGGLTLWVFNSSGVIPSASSVSGAQQDEGPIIAEVTLPMLGGGQVNLLQDRGEVTVLFAMSYWCTTCVPEAQALVRLYDEFEDEGLKVIVIDLDPDVSAEHLQTFIDEVGQNRLIWAFDPDVQFMRGFNVQALDTTIIVNRDGREVYRDIRSTSYDTLRGHISALLGA